MLTSTTANIEKGKHLRQPGAERGKIVENFTGCAHDAKMHPHNEPVSFRVCGWCASRTFDSQIQYYGHKGQPQQQDK